MLGNTERNKGIMLLDDGSIYYGVPAGFTGTATGELCFNTGMTGYQEIFTDPSYSNQLLVLTNVHIGNYGVKEDEVESDKIQIAGLVVRNFTNEYFRRQADDSLQSYLERNKLVCVHDIDTRAIVRNVRDKGAMNCIISNDGTSVEDLKLQLKKVPSMTGLELASGVSTDSSYYIGDENAEHRVAVLDYGVKKSILSNIADRGCYLKVFNAKTRFDEIEKFSPDAYFLSNGPGDPEPMDYAIKLAEQIMETNKPIFGICLGHQVLALTLGLKTYKMHNGHRGINHPVMNLETGLSEITSQNHGFGLDRESVEAKSDTIKITHVNLNDDSVEGIRVKGKNIFSVQYHPEASPGPHDSRYLFDEFVKNINNYKNN